MPKSKPKRASSRRVAVSRLGKEFGDHAKMHLKLYVAGKSPRSVAAFANLKTACEQHIPGQYKIQLIDLWKNPQLASAGQILAVPELVRKLPPPICKLIGDLSNKEKFLIGLNIV